MTKLDTNKAHPKIMFKNLVAFCDPESGERLLFESYNFIPTNILMEIKRGLRLQLKLQICRLDLFFVNEVLLPPAIVLSGNLHLLWLATKFEYYPMRTS